MNKSQWDRYIKPSIEPIDYGEYTRCCRCEYCGEVREDGIHTDYGAYCSGCFAPREKPECGRYPACYPAYSNILRTPFDDLDKMLMMSWAI